MVWLIWGGIMLGLSVQVVVAWFGRPQRQVAPRLMIVGVVLLALAFGGGAVLTAARGDVVDASRYGTLFLAVAVLAVVERRNHVRGTPTVQAAGTRNGP